MEESGLCSNIIRFDPDRKTDHINVKSVYLKEEQKGVSVHAAYGRIWTLLQYNSL